MLQKRFDPKKLPPITKWKAEREQLTAEKQRLNRDYTKLKGETAKVEKIRRNVYDIVKAETKETQRTKRHDMEL